MATINFFQNCVDNHGFWRFRILYTILHPNSAIQVEKIVVSIGTIQQ